MNGTPVSEADYTEERARRLVEREFNLSYMEHAPAHNTHRRRQLVRAGRARALGRGGHRRSAWAGSSATS